MDDIYYDVLDAQKTVDRIFRICKFYGIKNFELAELMSVSVQTVSKWKKGEGFPKWDRVILFAYTIGLPLDLVICRSKGSGRDNLSKVKEKIKQAKIQNRIQTLQKLIDEDKLAVYDEYDAFGEQYWNPLSQSYEYIDFESSIAAQQQRDIQKYGLTRTVSEEEKIRNEAREEMKQKLIKILTTDYKFLEDQILNVLYEMNFNFEEYDFYSDFDKVPFEEQLNIIISRINKKQAECYKYFEEKYNLEKSVIHEIYLQSLKNGYSDVFADGYEMTYDDYLKETDYAKYEERMSKAEKNSTNFKEDYVATPSSSINSTEICNESEADSEEVDECKNAGESLSVFDSYNNQEHRFVDENGEYLDGVRMVPVEGYSSLFIVRFRDGLIDGDIYNENGNFMKVMPAVEGPGHVEYWRKGKLHRDDEEAAVITEGFRVKQYWYNGVLVR